MNRYRLLLVTVFFFVGLILAAPALIGALPDRYVFRLPEPLQKYGLPENQVALLPTAEAPVAAASLLSTATEAAQKPATEATPTPEKSSVVDFKPATIANPERSNETAGQPSDAAPGSSSITTPTAMSTVTPAATAIQTPTPWPLPEQARLEGFQHKFQTWNNCGPATLAMGLTFFGEQASQEQTASVLKPNPEDRNVSPDEMAGYVNEQTHYGALYRVNGTIETLKKLVANDIPVIIETGIDPPGEFRWLGWYGHYLLVVAYSNEEEQFWVYDSWFGTSEEPLKNAHPDGRVISYNDLTADWSQFNQSYIVLYRPEQESLVAELIGQDLEDETMWERALSRSKAEIETAPGNPFYWFNLGTNYAALQQFEEAAIAFDQARAIGLPWRMLWYQFGPYEAYLNVGRYEDVLLLADTTLKDRPYFEESFYYKAIALAALGEADTARQNLEKAANLNPNFVPAQMALVELK